MGLTAGHGDRVVVEDLVRDVDARRDGGADRQNAGVEVGPVAEIGEDVLLVGERRLTDPGHAFAAHLGEGLRPPVHPRRHVMAADAGHGAAALRHHGGGVVRAAGAEERLALHQRLPRLGVLLPVEELDAAADALVVEELQQAAADRHGDAGRRQLVIGRQQLARFLVELADDARAHVRVPVVKLFLELVLDERPLFLDHDDLFQTLGEAADAFALQRPRHGDLVDGQPDIGGHLLGNLKIVQRLPDVQIALAGRDHAQPGPGRGYHRLVQPVGAGEGQSRVELVLHQPLFLLERRIGPADIEPADRHVELRQDVIDAQRVDRHGSGAFDRLGDRLEGDPAAGKARHRPAHHAEIEEFLNARRVQHRDHGMHEGMLGLVRERGGLAAMVVAGQHQHAAMARRSRRVAVLEHVARPVHARTLAVPHGIDAVIARTGEHADLLAAPNGGGAQLLVHARLKLDMVGGQELPRLPQRLIESAQRRSAIP